MTANVYMEILLFVGHGPFNLQLIFTIPADNNDHLLEADASTFICSVLDKSHLGADHHFELRPDSESLWKAPSYESTRFGLQPS